MTQRSKSGRFGAVRQVIAAGAMCAVAFGPSVARGGGKTPTKAAAKTARALICARSDDGWTLHCISPAEVIARAGADKLRWLAELELAALLADAPAVEDRPFSCDPKDGSVYFVRGTKMASAATIAKWAALRELGALPDAAGSFPASTGAVEGSRSERDAVIGSFEAMLDEACADSDYRSPQIGPAGAAIIAAAIAAGGAIIAALISKDDPPEQAPNPWPPLMKWRRFGQRASSWM